jgi:hypothetical protein
MQNEALTGLSLNPIAVGFCEGRFQKIFAQSPLRFDITTFQLGLPYLRDAGGRLKLSYPFFSGSELSGQFVSQFYGLLVICLSSTSGAVKCA